MDRSRPFTDEVSFKLTCWVLDKAQYTDSKYNSDICFVQSGVKENNRNVSFHESEFIFG